MNPTAILQELLDSLPEGHHERPGLHRAIEFLRVEQRPDAFWFVDVDGTVEATDFKWVAVLQAPGGCFPLPIWHPSEAACVGWIEENVIGVGLKDER
jgi:hypothetical protein